MVGCIIPMKPRMFYVLLAVLAAVILLPVLGILAVRASSGRPATLGVKDGQLAPCPNSPNCVSSQSLDEAHRVKPLPLSMPAAQAIDMLQQVLAEVPRIRVVTVRDGYLHAEATSRLIGFVDDVEFLVDEDVGVIHVRSASRVGYSDLGVNRARVEQIRSALTSAGSH